MEAPWGRQISQASREWIREKRGGKRGTLQDSFTPPNRADCNLSFASELERAHLFPRRERDIPTWFFQRGVPQPKLGWVSGSRRGVTVAVWKTVFQEHFQPCEELRTRKCALSSKFARVGTAEHAILVKFWRSRERRKKGPR